MSFGPLVFVAPWLLGALLVLPVIWWLLRVTPPAPHRLPFPAIRLLRDLFAREETPDRTPWWLLALRLLLAALVIVALARPVINPESALPGSGPVLLVVDSGWAAARDWPARQQALHGVLERADRAGRSVILLETAAAPDGTPPRPTGLMRASEARGAVEALIPRPWPTDREAALEALETLSVSGSVHTVWMTDGLGDAVADRLARRLQQFGSAELLAPEPDGQAHLLRPPEADGGGLAIEVARTEPGPARQIVLHAIGADGRLVEALPLLFDQGARLARGRLELPLELRNELVRLEIAGEPSAGATALLDARWQRRPVGMVGAGGDRAAQPLLSGAHYLAQALAPYAEIRRGDPIELIADGLSVLLLPDEVALSGPQRDAIAAWIAEGGVAVRFAGPALAANPDGLVPVRLREGDRRLSGALSWTEPMPLAPFPETGPFADLAVSDEVRVHRQVLAEPSLELAERTWARLADGTPLVTAARAPVDAPPAGDGAGWLVLVHTSAGPDWSDLALSTLYIEMLRRIVALGEGVAGGDAATRPLAPVRGLDGLGRLGAPSASARPLGAAALARAEVGPLHPPGYYGTEDMRRALNLGDAVGEPTPLGAMPSGVAVNPFRTGSEVPLMPWLLAVVLVLAVVDIALSLILRGYGGRLRGRRKTAGGAVAGAVLLAALALAAPGSATADDSFALRAANGTWLAYVLTGVEEVDAISAAGLNGLSRVLTNRTSIEPDGAMGVNIAEDELAFFPLLYWPVVPEQPPPDAATVDRLNRFLRHGGTILFDTRDRGEDGPGSRHLRELTRALDIPALMPVPAGHVLAQAFYLIDDFPGRFVGGEVWVERTQDHINDGVSSVIIGGNDWAGAWAVDPGNRPLYAAVPGGERQREMAYRFGVNLMMYALTGNYKADQVHVPAILERLGQ